ncbi:MAG: beta-N-acetylhexosaminidase [Alphaproteobacteria bacterium]|nr:beta-N-acetylhexosaminidase [Alphaproteobacteria bacterium]
MFSKCADQALAVILSLSETSLSADEKAFFKDSNPLGFILFSRNCETPDQLKALIDDLKDTMGRDCPVLIDQEGGCVQRLKPPVWYDCPSMKKFGDLALNDRKKALEDLCFTTLKMAKELCDVGINVNCAPVLDVLTLETHNVIGDRAFSDDPKIVSSLGLSVCRQYLESGITPVIKHLPGHGRAMIDSHKDLPHVNASLEELENDFYPFCNIASSNIGSAVWGMVAHVVYDQIDSDYPASVSSKIIREIIRERIGFDGFLLSDDLNMEALADYGDILERVNATIKAGCDAALYCWADIKVMEKIAETVPKIGIESYRRLQKADEFTKLAIWQ